MEIIKLNTSGYYFYCPDLQSENYDKYLTKKKLLNECAICKRFILESSYDSITNNHNIVHESEVTIGKCGHMYHSDCITSWLKTNNVCPIDKVNWQTFRVADSYTKLVLKEDKFKKTSKSTCVTADNKNPSENKTNKFYPKKYDKTVDSAGKMGKVMGEVMSKKGFGYPSDHSQNIIDPEKIAQVPIVQIAEIGTNEEIFHYWQNSIVKNEEFLTDTDTDDDF
jgi:hypothetical protein